MIEADPRFLQVRRQKNLLRRFFVSNKMLPVKSLAQEPISYFYDQECNVYAHTPMHTSEIWKKIYRFF